jgi:mRNA-degrading endonuclease toxin of MazEF toxin-antitoxin module
LVIARGDVYWVDFRGAPGAEIRKVRPAVVVSEDDHNECMGTVTVVPLSSAPTSSLDFQRIKLSTMRPAQEKSRGRPSSAT